MSKKVCYLANNSEEIRKELREAGVKLCKCSEFEGAIWLSAYPDLNDVHGLGYNDESDDTHESTPQGRVEFAVIDCIRCRYDITIVHDVKDFIKLIKEE